MAVWPQPAFTSGIYRVANPQSTLHLAALFHVSVCSQIGTRNGAESNQIPRRMAVRLRGQSLKDLGTRGKLVAVLLSLSTMFGCGALEAGQPGVQSSTGLVATSPVLNFGTVPV